MRPDQAERAERAMARAYNMVAGDYVVHVDAADTETGLLTIQMDLSGAAESDEGLEIGPAGMLAHGARELTFLKSYLVEKGVMIRPTSHFLIAGKRWDVIKDEPIRDNVVPLAGIQNLVIVWVRKAVELEATEEAEFTYGD